MAFEGYKNATKEINQEMLENLLSTTLLHISSNPLGIYESGNNHGTPFNELISGLNKTIRKKRMRVRADENGARIDISNVGEVKEDDL